MSTIEKSLLPFLILLTFLFYLPTRGSSEQLTSVPVGTGQNTDGETSAANTTPSSGADNRYCKPNDIPMFGALKDGWATLPTSCFYTALSVTPSPGVAIPVTTSDELQTAIYGAQCGDTISLQAGATFLSSAAGFVLPAKTPPLR